MTAISDKRAALAASGFDVGTPVTDEIDAPGGGKVRHFEIADIYWSAATGAHEVHGAIRDKYDALGGPASFLGYPLTDELGTPEGRGRFNNLQGGSLYFDWNHPGSGAYVVMPNPPPCDDSPGDHGRWDVAPFTSGVVGVHAALLRNNKVLFFTYLQPPAGAPSEPTQYGATSVLDLHTGFVSTPSYVGDTAPYMENLFCAGQAFLGDGRLFVAGGERDYPGIRTESVTKIHLFRAGGPGGGRWEQVASFARGRWYPQCVTLPDGRVLSIGGAVRATTNGLANWSLEIYDPDTNTVGPEIPAPVVLPASSYPFVFVLPSNKVLVHAFTTTKLFDIASETWDAGSLEAVARPDRNGRTYPLQGTAVLLPLLPDSTPPYSPRVMMIGGAGPDPIHIDTNATRSCEILDFGLSPLQWRSAPPMDNARVMPDAVLLPDGTVFVTNGSREGGSDLGASPVFEAEIYDPATNTWRSACHMSTPRLYHATALLLPDGRVMTAGTDSAWNPVPYNQAQLRIEFYSPPYLFAGPRPVVGPIAPGPLEWGDTVVVPVDDPELVDRVVILRCGSVTHSFNSDQRYVGLVVVSRDSSSVTVVMPPDATIAPPGNYLLFAVTAEGVPSVGRYVRVAAPTFVKLKESKEFKEGSWETKVLANEHKLVSENWPFDPKKKDKDAENPGSWTLNQELVNPMLTRLAAVEQDLARVRAFIEPHERPTVGSHAMLGEHTAAMTTMGTPAAAPLPHGGHQPDAEPVERVEERPEVPEDHDHGGHDADRQDDGGHDHAGHDHGGHDHGGHDDGGHDADRPKPRGKP